jgi:autotransporter-associated beta strand protein
VSFAQTQAAQTNALPCALAGAGGLVQEGPGTLVLNGVNAFSGNATVKDGVLLVNTPLVNTTGLFADGGRLDLLATAPCLTNLTVRTATTVTIGGAALPFAEGLTLCVAQDGIIDLGFTNIADVDQLVLDGRARRPGLYGGVDSQAPTSALNAYFTGPGTLRVLSGPQPQGAVILFR